MAEASHSDIERSGAETEKRETFPLLAAATLSFTAWLAHSFAVENFLVSAGRLVHKFFPFLSR